MPQKLWTWVYGKEWEDLPKDPVNTLYRSCHITAKCRYNASIRLKRQGAFSFLTATILSLGLLLLPLLHLSGVPLGYPPPVLNMVQIFLATAVLVFSVINSSAHYETRAQALNTCGDRLKELSRELRTAKAEDPEHLDMDSLNDRYTDISRDSENHSRTDYCLAKLQAKNFFQITGLPALRLRFRIWIAAVGRYLLPSALLAAEVVIVLDVLQVTSVMTPILAPGP